MSLRQIRLFVVLGKILHDAPTYAVASTPGLRRVTQAVLMAGKPVKRLLKPLVELLSSSLGQCYEDWLAREDPVVWFRQRRVTGPSRGGSTSRGRGLHLS